MSFDAIGIVVSNMPKSIAFYELFGLKFTAFGDDGDHYEATLPSGMRLMLDTEALIKKLHPNITFSQGGRMGLGYSLETPAEVDELYKKVIAGGGTVEREPYDAFWGQRYATIKDPDGNLVSIYADLVKP